jgi:hypothetical protein
MSTIRVDNFGPSAGGTTYSARGIAKAWVNFNGTGTIAARDSENVSSLTDNGTGLYTINITNNFDAANYASTVGSTRSTSFSAERAASGQHAVGSFLVHNRNLASNTDTDVDELSGVTHGDLA